MSKLAVAVAATFGICATTASAARAAEPNPAVTAFEKGVALLESRRYDEACPLLQRSYQIEPMPGTLFTLAECENKRGRLATALSRYEEYLALHASLPRDKQLKQGDRPEIARAQKADLEQRAPSLRVLLHANLSKDVVVTRDDLLVREGEIGASIRIDPGEHVVAATAPGKNPWQKSITAAEYGRLVVIVPPLADASPSPAPAAPLPPPAPPPRPSDAHAGAGQRIAAGVSLGVGGASLVAATVLGVVAKNTWNELLSHCKDPGARTGCRPADAPNLDRAARLADASTAMFVIGGAAVAAAGALFFTAPRAKSGASTAWIITPAVGATGAGALIGRRF
jgi:hypothetical protein